MDNGWGHPNEALPDAILAALPTDPHEQLNLARKISAMAFASRMTKNEAESTKLRAKLSEKDNIILRMRERIGELEQSLQATNSHLSQVLEEQAKLITEKNALMASVKKLNRDVAKLETFKRTLIQSLEGEEDSTVSGQKSSSHNLAFNSSSTPSSSYRGSLLNKIRLAGDDQSSLSSVGEEDIYGSRQGNRKTFLSTTPPNLTPTSLTPTNLTPTNLTPRSLTPTNLTPTHRTPQRTPTGSPGRQATSPRFQSASGSPKRLSTGENKAPRFFSQPVSHHTTAPNSPPFSGSVAARAARIDGKEFFRQARSRLSFEQFSAFLKNIKELNAHKQTREETLRRAEEIFGSENKDLYNAFSGLLGRSSQATTPGR